jgi:hypothetical protein
MTSPVTDAQVEAAAETKRSYYDRALNALQSAHAACFKHIERLG